MPAPAEPSILRIPHFAPLLAGRFAAVFASQVLSVTVGWELFERTGSAWSLGMVGLIELLPVLALMFPAGNAADRHPRRNVAMFAHSLLVATALGLAFAAQLHAPVVFIYAMLLFVGAARAFASPSVGSIVPQIVPIERLAKANAWTSASFELAAISGPAAGGALIALTHGARVSYLVTAAGHLAFVLLLSTIPAKAPPPAAAHHDAGEVFAGLSFVRRQPVFLAAITLDLFAVLLGGAVALLPLYTKNVLGVGPTELGWLRAAPSLGALAMTLALARIGPFRRPGVALLVAVAGFGAATIGFGLSRSLWLSLLCLFLTGAFDMISVIIRHTLEQVLTPDRLRGRVSALNYVFIGFSNELGAFESGATAALFGPIVSVVGGGIGTLVVVAIVAIAWPALARIGPLHTLRPSPEP